MKCPLDSADLQMTDRQGIEIDYCPACRGVWLDRGELDKLIERGGVPQQAPAAPAAPRYEQKEYRQEYGHSNHKRKEGFLGDLFDF